MSSITTEPHLLSLEAFAKNPYPHLQRWNFPVILINGVTTSGKTSLARNLADYDYQRVSLDEICTKILRRCVREENPHLYSESQAIIRSDDFLKLYFNYVIDKSKYEAKQIEQLNQLTDCLNRISLATKNKIFSDSAVYQRLSQKAEKILAKGHKVVIDSVLDNNDLLNLFENCLKNQRIVHLLLYCPVSTLLQRCKVRNLQAHFNNNCDFRTYDKILDQYDQFYCPTAHPEPHAENFHVDSSQGEIQDSVDTWKNKICLIEEKTKLIDSLERIQEESTQLLKLLYSNPDSNILKENRAKVESSINRFRKRWLADSPKEIYLRPNIRFDLILFLNRETAVQDGQECQNFSS